MTTLNVYFKVFKQSDKNHKSPLYGRLCNFSAFEGAIREIANENRAKHDDALKISMYWRTPQGARLWIHDTDIKGNLIVRNTSPVSDSSMFTMAKILGSAIDADHEFTTGHKVIGNMIHFTHHQSQRKFTLTISEVTS